MEDIQEAANEPSETSSWTESSPGDEIEVDVLGNLDLSEVDLQLKEKLCNLSSADNFR